MKVLLYSQNQKTLSKSGIGHALSLQKQALEKQGVQVTFDPNDTYDICHINTMFNKSYYFMRKLQKMQIPVVVHGHSTKEDFRNSFKFSNYVSNLFNHSLIKMYSKAEYIITPTNYSKKLIENYGIKAKIFAVSNGINLEQYFNDTKYNPDEVDAFYKFINIKPTDKFIIGMGFYFVRKGLHDFIEVAKEFPNIKFIWFGHMYKGLTSKPILNALKNKPDNVILPGYIGMNYKKIAFAKAELFFFPSYEETEGIVTLEALASKLPLLVRDIPVYEGWLKNNYNCHMGKNNEDFIKKIKVILSEDQTTIINNGYETVKKRDISETGKELVKIYKEIINASKS